MRRAKIIAQRMAKSGRNKCTKVLCPNEAIGRMMGAQGANIKKMEEENTVSIMVSKRDETFPGTNERVIDIMGNLPALRVCVNTVQEHIRSTGGKGVTPPPRHTYCIIILSNDAAGKILGNSMLTNKWKVQIETSDRKAMSLLMERWVKVSGAPAQVEGCINEVITLSVEPGVKPLMHGLCYAGIGSIGFAETAQRKDEFAVPSSSKTAVPPASKTSFPSASKPAETRNKFAPLSKASVNKDKAKAAELEQEEARQTVAVNRRRSEDASPDTSPDASPDASLDASPDTSPSRLGELETEEEYFDLTGYSVYHIINLDTELPVKMMIMSDL